MRKKLEQNRNNLYLSGMPIPSLFDLNRDPYASANEVALYGAQLHDVRFLRQFA